MTKALPVANIISKYLYLEGYDGTHILRKCGPERNYLFPAWKVT